MFKNMKFGVQLYLLVGFLSILLMIIGMLGMYGIKKSNASLTTIYNDRLVPIEILAEYNGLRRDNMEEMLLAQFHDPGLAASTVHEADHPLSKHTDIVVANRQEMGQIWEQYMATDLSPEEEELVKTHISQHTLAFDREVESALSLFKARKFAEASLHNVNTLHPLYSKIEKGVRTLMQLQVDIAAIEKDKTDASYVRTRNLAITSIISGILVAIGLGWWLIRSVMGRISESVSTISSSATQISATISQHERTSSQQATAANETSATIEELSRSARQSAEQATNAAAQAEESGAATIQGSDATQQTVTAMAKLETKISAIAEQILHLGEQSDQVGSIATLLKDLAGQINMLALNAAVEAARAGEHGKGFAVVAGEIRKLADQSKKSAEQTAVLVRDIQKATNSSIMMTDEGNRTVTEVTQLVEKVAALFSNLTSLASSASENAQQVMLNAQQQSAAFTQVVKATNDISAGTKETAAGISQTKIGIENLQGAAENLKAIT
ncbi:MAG: methyl-accepting chemotaxis protein [Desulfobulbaceae bacterium]|jgi:methyl-accepting chemotaxis protein|nr:methyl-accepting chemotaxis protein [Desulfobulbaceae bacterium]